MSISSGFNIIPWSKAWSKYASAVLFKKDKVNLEILQRQGSGGTPPFSITSDKKKVIVSGANSGNGGSGS